MTATPPIPPADPDSPEDDAALIEAWLAHGDEQAARLLIDRLHPRVSGIIRRHWNRAEDWEDLEQEAFVRVFENLHRYKPKAPFPHWVSRITLNVCRSRWRSQSRRPLWRWSDLSESEQRVFDEARGSTGSFLDPEARDARRLMHRLLDTLGDKDRLVLSLLHLEERSIAEIADLTGMRPSAVKVRAHRARKRLHEAWKRLEAEQENARDV